MSSEQNQVDCQKCGSPTKVIDTRRTQISDSITLRRIRKCEVCKSKHYTCEIIDIIYKDVFYE